MNCAVCGDSINGREYWIPYTFGRISGEEAVCHDCYLRRTAR